MLCHTRIPCRSKGRFNKTSIRLTMLYGDKCWAIKIKKKKKGVSGNKNEFSKRGE